MSDPGGATSSPGTAVDAARSRVAGRTALVVGASRGLGRGIAEALAAADARVVAVARNGASLDELAAAAPSIRTEPADATDPATASSLLDRYAPTVLVLVAGAVPVMRPLQEHTWATFSVNWEADVKIAFTWLREALIRPLSSDSRIVVVGSGAGLNGSPASGGYAGAKATQRFIADYAREESRRAGLGLGVTTVIPAVMTSYGEVGRAGIHSYAATAGQTEEQFEAQFGTPLTPRIAGEAVVSLVRADLATTEPSYLLTGDGLRTPAGEPFV